MVCKGALARARWWDCKKVRKWNVLRWTPKGTCPEPLEILDHAPLTGFPEKQPRLEGRAWDNRKVTEQLVTKFGAVPTPQCLDHADDLAAGLEPCHTEGLGDEMRYQAICRQNYMRTGNQDAKQRRG
jgi:hypothetical protein